MTIYYFAPSREWWLLKGGNFAAYKKMPDFLKNRKLVFFFKNARTVEKIKLTLS